MQTQIAMTTRPWKKLTNWKSLVNFARFVVLSLTAFVYEAWEYVSRVIEMNVILCAISVVACVVSKLTSFLFGILDILRNINDPEHPLTLEQLNVTQLEHIKVDNKNNVIKVPIRHVLWRSKHDMT